MTNSTLSIEVSLIRNVGDGMETCNAHPDTAQGYGVYIRNPTALHVLDFSGGDLDRDDAQISMREAHHNAFLYAGTLASHLGCDVVTTIAIGADHWWSRFVVVPQRDHFAGAAGDETRFEQCEEGEATQWAVFRATAAADGREAVYGDSLLVEDYPTRAAAEAAAAALDRGQPLPEPEWPAQPVAPLSVIVDGCALLDGVTDAGIYSDDRAYVHLADGRVLRVSVEVVGG